LKCKTNEFHLVFKEPMMPDYGSSERFLKEIQERSDDIEKIVLLPPGLIGTAGVRVDPPTEGISLLIRFLDGTGQRAIHPDDVEIILNDGILNRMRIKIEVFRGDNG
jgi:hypothetical protein